MQAILARYSFNKALPYLLPVAVEFGNQTLNFLGTVHVQDATKQGAIVLLSFLIGDFLRAMTKGDKQPLEVIHRFQVDPPPDYPVIDATTH